jgi:hypothetical protein
MRVQGCNRLKLAPEGVSHLLPFSTLQTLVPW